MPRSNRPRRPTGRSDRPERVDDEPGDLSRVLYGGRHTEVRRGLAWTVQSISGSTSVKAYICPGCSLPVEPGTAHIVAWRADGLFGEEADLAARRHWHNHCWKIS